VVNCKPLQDRTCTMNAECCTGYCFKVNGASTSGMWNISWPS
jgi:hypothetical protein